jgi:hypothetical protein
MDLTRSWSPYGAEIERTGALGTCAICLRRTAGDMFMLRECLDLAVPRQAWLLCWACFAAVIAELERSMLRTPLRIRIAVGMVAAERSPRSRYPPGDARFWEQFSQRQVDALVACFVLFLFIMPSLLYLITAAIAANAAKSPRER